MKQLMIFSFISIFLSCNKDCDNQTNQNKDCLGLPEEPFHYHSCEIVDSFYFMYYCDIFKYGQIKLETNSKQYVPQFCEDIGKPITFQNLSGKNIIFELVYKSFNKEHVINNTNQRCMNDSSRIIGFCTDIEEIVMILYSKELSTKLYLFLKPQFDYQNISIQTYGDFLSIERLSNNEYVGTEFIALISQRTLTYTKYYNQIYYDSIKLGEKLFRNVISNDKTGSPNPQMEYYYNKEIGLLGFRDTSNVVWYRTN